MQKKYNTILAIYQATRTVIAYKKNHEPRKIAYRKEIQTQAPHICAKVHHWAFKPEANLAKCT